MSSTDIEIYFATQAYRFHCLCRCSYDARVTKGVTKSQLIALRINYECSLTELKGRQATELNCCQHGRTKFELQMHTLIRPEARFSF